MAFVIPVRPDIKYSREMIKLIYCHFLIPRSTLAGKLLKKLSHFHFSYLLQLVGRLSWWEWLVVLILRIGISKQQTKSRWQLIFGFQIANSEVIKTGSQPNQLSCSDSKRGCNLAQRGRVDWQQCSQLLKWHQSKFTHPPICNMMSEG